MRPAFIAFALLAAASGTPASAQAAPAAPAARPQVRIPGVSPAGNAALTQLQGKIDPAAVALAREDAAVGRQMQAALAGPTIDIAKLTAAMRRTEAVAAKARAINDDHLLTAVRALPPADRAPFLRAIVQQQTQRPPAPAPAR